MAPTRHDRRALGVRSIMGAFAIVMWKAIASSVCEAALEVWKSEPSAPNLAALARALDLH
jgi:hypothetical protein